MTRDSLTHLESEPKKELKIPQDLINNFWLERHPEFCNQDSAVRKKNLDAVMGKIIRAYLDSRGFSKVSFEQEKGVWGSTRIYLSSDRSKYFDLKFEDVSIEDYQKPKIIIKVAPEDQTKNSDLSGQIVLLADQKFIEKVEDENKRRLIEQEKKVEEEFKRQIAFLNVILNQIGFGRRVHAEKNALLREYIRQSLELDPKGFEIIFVKSEGEIWARFFKNNTRYYQLPIGIYDVETEEREQEEKFEKKRETLKQFCREFGFNRLVTAKENKSVRDFLQEFYGDDDSKIEDYGLFFEEKPEEIVVKVLEKEKVWVVLGLDK